MPQKSSADWVTPPTCWECLGAHRVIRTNTPRLRRARVKLRPPRSKTLSFGDGVIANSSPFSRSGQIVVEYALLLVVGITVASLVISVMVSRNPESPGFLIAKWDQIIRTIGQDLADEPAAPPGGDD